MLTGNTDQDRIAGYPGEYIDPWGSLYFLLLSMTLGIVGVQLPLAVTCLGLHDIPEVTDSL